MTFCPQLRYCGQAGLDRATILFDRLTALQGGAPNPSFVADSVLYKSQEGERQLAVPARLLVSRAPLQ